MNTERQPKLSYLRETPLRSVLTVYLLIAGLVLLPTNKIGGIFAEDELTIRLIGMAVSRAAYCILMIFLLYELGFQKVLLPKDRRLSALLPALPCLLIAINNLPIYELATGKACVTTELGALLLFAIQCLCVGAFEEISFRGIIFPLLLDQTGNSPKGRTIAVLTNGALFGMLHLCNLIGNLGAIGAVAMQIGYSFLLGCMLAVLVWNGTGIGSCILLHALYNFCGMLIDTLGSGIQWTTFRIVLTIVVSVAVGVYCIQLLLRSKTDRNTTDDSNTPL